MSYESGAILLGSSVITVIDIVAVLLVVILVLIGLKKGFSKQLFGLIGGTAVILGASYLAPTVGQWISPVLSSTIRKPIASWVAGIAADAETTVFTEVLNWADEVIRNESMPIALTAMGLPSLVSGLLGGALGGIFEKVGLAALETALPEVLTTWALTAIAFIVLMLLFSVVLALLKKAFKGLTRITAFGMLDKILGMIFGMLKGYVIISAVLALFLIIPPGFLGMSAVNDQITRSTLVLFLYENNIIAAWMLSLMVAA